jgi:hypothetical protein
MEAPCPGYSQSKDAVSACVSPGQVTRVSIAIGWAGRRESAGQYGVRSSTSGERRCLGDHDGRSQSATDLGCAWFRPISIAIRTDLEGNCHQHHFTKTSPVADGRPVDSQIHK